jgi:hypothetical protein
MVRWTKLYLIYIYLKKLIHRFFKFSPFICNNWIASVIFFIFWFSKIRISSTGIVSFLSLPRCRLFSGRRRHVVSHLLPIEDELAAFTPSSGHVSLCRLPSRVKIDALNSYHRHWPPTIILQCYKKVISTLTLLSPPLNRVSILSPP